MAAYGAAPAKIFISYRRADSGWTTWLADQLARQFGTGVVFQDVDSIQPGDDFAAAIEAAVGACAVMLAVIGPQWLAARGLNDPQDWVRLEIEAALRRGVRVIPVLVDGARMPTAAELPPSLRGLDRRQAVALSPGSLDIRRLLSVLSAAVADTGTGGPQANAQGDWQAKAEGDRQEKVLAAFDRGIQLDEQGDLAGSEAAYRESLRLDPSFLPSFVNLGTVLEQMERWSEAEAMYREALRLDPPMKIPRATTSTGS